MNSKKRNLSVVSVLAIVGLIIFISVVTFALYRDTRTPYQSVTFGKIEISEGDKYNEQITLANALPGDKLTDKISFSKSIDSDDMYVRVKLLFRTDNPNLDDVVNELNNTDPALVEGENYSWSKKFNNIYYLTEKDNTDLLLNIDDVGEYVFANEIVLSEDIEQIDDLYFEDIELIVEVQALQSYGVSQNLIETSELFANAFGDVSAYTDINDFTFSNTTLTKYTGSSKNVVIPTSYSIISNPSNAIGAQATLSNAYTEGNQYEIKTLGGSAFANNTNIEYVYIPDSVTSVSSYVFQNCTNLKEVRLSENMTSLGAGMFESCVSLKSFTIPNQIKSVGSYVFRDCGSLESVSFEEGSTVTNLSNYIFYDCSSLSEVTLPDSLTQIGNYAFQNCSSLQNITIPDSVTIIGISAFYNCNKLLSIKIPAGVTNIQSSTFYGCKYLNEVTFGNADNLTTIGNGAFYNTNLTEFTIPQNVSSIDSRAFASCYKLVHLINKSGVNITTSIKNTLPDQEIVSDASEFQNTLNTNDGNYITYSVSSNNKKYLLGIYEPQNILDDVPDDITDIGQNSFSTNYDIYSIEIPSSVTNIGANAFSSCYNLVKVVANSNFSTGSNAFASCYKLVQKVKPNGSFSGTSVSPIDSEVAKSEAELKNKLTIENGYIIYTTSNDKYLMGKIGEKQVLDDIPNDVTKIYTYAFYSNYDIKSVKLSKNISEILDNSFYCCTNLSKVTFNDKLTSMGMSAFRETNLSSIDLPNSLKTIGNSAFYSCNLSTLVLPVSIESIGSSAFAYNSKLKVVEILSELTSLSTNLFSYCSKIEKVTMPDSITSLEGSVFYNCSSLKSITLPKNLKTIGNSVFYGCSNLENIFIPNSLKSIGESAFSGCSKIDNFNIPLSVTDIGRNAFNNTKWYNNQSNGALYLDGWYLGFKGSKPSTDFAVADGAKGVCQYAFNGFTSAKITLPDTVKYLGAYAFNNCTNLTSVTLSNGLTELRNNTFYNCSNLDNVTIPYLVSSFGAGCFSNCTNLSTIFLPTSLTNIGSSCFYNCSALSSIELPLSLKEIAGSAFSNSGLTEITVPKNVVRIGNYAFQNCYYLTSIEYNAINCSDITSNSNYIFYNAGRDSENGIELIFGSEVRHIPSRLFYPSSRAGCEPNIASINILEDNSLESIGEYAFYGLSKITEITIPKGVTYIGSNAFNNCTSLQKIYYNAINCNKYITTSNIFTNVGTAEGCSGTKVIFGEKVEIICNYLFSGAGVLSVEFLGNKVSTIGDRAFNGCESLTSINLPTSVTYIGDYAFNNTGLTQINLNKGINFIGEYAFANCAALTKISIPKSTSTICENAFINCQILNEIYYDAENVTQEGGGDIYWTTYCFQIVEIMEME